MRNTFFLLLLMSLAISTLNMSALAGSRDKILREGIEQLTKSSDELTRVALRKEAILAAERQAAKETIERTFKQQAKKKSEPVIAEPILNPSQKTFGTQGQELKQISTKELMERGGFSRKNSNNYKPIVKNDTQLQDIKALEKTGRGKNHLASDPKSQGPHSTFRHDANGNISHHAEWTPNSKNPTGFDQTKRIDTQYSNPHTHVNKSTRDTVPTPHAHDQSALGGVRPARPDELPR